jgi:hypothetical protein
MAARGFLEAGEHAKERGLAASARPHDGYELTWLEGYGDVVKCNCSIGEFDLKAVRSHVGANH